MNQILKSFCRWSIGGHHSTSLGLYGGSKYFLTENLNVDAEVQLSFNLGSNPDTDLGTMFEFQVGVGFIIAT